MSSTGLGLHLTSLIVADYDAAIAFFVSKLGFDLVEDSPALTNDGRTKRWVVVRPPGNPHGSGVLLALADGPEQRDMIGRQFAGRVGMFWHVDDFNATYERLVEAGVGFAEKPRSEPYGKVVVFYDVSGNKWDLIGPVKA